MEKTTSALSVVNVNHFQISGSIAMQSFDYIDEMVAWTISPIIMSLLLVVAMLTVCSKRAKSRKHRALVVDEVKRLLSCVVLTNDSSGRRRIHVKM